MVNEQDERRVQQASKGKALSLKVQKGLTRETVFWHAQKGDLIERCDIPLGRCSMFHIAVGCGMTIALPQAFTFVVKQKGS